MATYAYRCPEHGEFDVSRPLGSATPTFTCRVCGGDAIRVYSSPMLARTPRALVTARERDEKSREAPEVVTSLPPRKGGRRPAPANPMLQRLPRP